jgi:hypothetical protein
MSENGPIRRFLRTLFGSPSQAISEPQPFPLGAEDPVPASAAPEALVLEEASAEPPLNEELLSPIPLSPRPVSSMGTDPVSAPPGPMISEETAEKLSRLPQALQDLAEAIRSQTGFNERLQEVLTSLSEPDPDWLQALEDLSGESRKQTDLLQSLVEKMGEKRQFEAESADAISRLPSLLEALHRSTTTLTEMMAQARDRWANTKDDLAREMVRQGRKGTALVIAILVILAVQTALLAFHFIGGR